MESAEAMGLNRQTREGESVTMSASVRSEIGECAVRARRLEAAGGETPARESWEPEMVANP